MIEMKDMSFYNHKVNQSKVKFSNYWMMYFNPSDIQVESSYDYNSSIKHHDKRTCHIYFKRATNQLQNNKNFKICFDLVFIILSLFIVLKSSNSYGVRQAKFQ